jgi:hypothetical protein
MFELQNVHSYMLYWLFSGTVFQSYFTFSEVLPLVFTPALKTPFYDNE